MCQGRCAPIGGVWTARGRCTVTREAAQGLVPRGDGAQEAHRRCAGGAQAVRRGRTDEKYRGYYGCPDTRGSLGTAWVKGDAPLPEGSGVRRRHTGCAHEAHRQCAGGARRCTGGAQAVHRRCTEVHRRCTGGAQEVHRGAQAVHRGVQATHRRRTCDVVHRRCTETCRRRTGGAHVVHRRCTGLKKVCERGALRLSFQTF